LAVPSVSIVSPTSADLPPSAITTPIIKGDGRWGGVRCWGHCLAYSGRLSAQCNHHA
jgi:hypothetical protein